MRFQKYPSIENHYRTEFIERIRLEGMDGGDWVATEKIHGANFSIWVNATNTRIAKRSGLIPDDTGFFNVHQIAPELKEKAREVFRDTKREQSKVKEVAIYGELFGGCYPHPKVVENPRFKKVQQGVWYSPELRFAVYDIKIDGVFLPFLIMQMTAFLAGFQIVPVIKEGTFDECLSLRNDYSSVVHKQQCLPKIKDNIMEGMVIRPMEDRYLRRGERVIIKSKNRKFSETRDRKPRKEVKLPKEGQEIIEVAFPMITANRYDAVVSKVGDVTAKDFGRILGLIIQDIHEELIDNHTKLYMNYQNMDKQERKLIHRVLAPEVATLVREQLLGIKPSGGQK